MSRAEVKWMGDGTWEPESVCFDWTNEDFKVRIVFYQAGGQGGPPTSIELLLEFNLIIKVREGSGKNQTKDR